MNDFTKQELQQMLIGLGWLYGVSVDDDFLDKLSTKIQVLIDNYCEHEYQDYQPGTGAIPFCIKCRRYF